MPPTDLRFTNSCFSGNDWIDRVIFTLGLRVLSLRYITSLTNFDGHTKDYTECRMGRLGLSVRMVYLASKLHEIR
jgi:hypothetical protein